ncbi:cytoskeletal protein RodZ [Defluviimonas denitrificans]|jgi:cytoskeletal protein RodZ|uniref:Cytoskeletal protein RodZ n=1 Tax=Albidovulum denitrificans TaxID=404881 RepID=A0A2S8SDE4_9RHOB|nr:helix-turn-helix domain-containing protein [Defluviimonas denitrificans]PQV58813.1 cytoskeletal protein RodZ [Defluviimonas denitrificans]
MIGRRTPPSTQEESKPKGFDDFEVRLGDTMRGERATMAKSLLDVQRELKIKASYIAAIENCDVSAFETPGFVAGYVRSYARYLGMDPEWAFQRFCEEANFTVSHGMSAAASGPKKSVGVLATAYADPLANPKAPFVPQGESVWSGIQPGAIGSIAVLLILIGGLGYGGWTVLNEVQKVQLAPVDQAPGVVAELDPLSSAGGKAANQAEATEIALAQRPATDEAPQPEAFDRLYRPEALDVPVLVARDGPIAAIDPRTVGALADAVPQADAEDAVNAAVKLALGDTPVQVVAPDAPQVELLAVRPAWVRVTSADGTTIFEKVLDAGERYALPKLEEAPVLRVGESGALYFAVNGQTYGPAGARGSVTKNVTLSPDALTTAYAVADMTQDADLAKFATADAAGMTGALAPTE